MQRATHSLATHCCELSAAVLLMRSDSFYCDMLLMSAAVITVEFKPIYVCAGGGAEQSSSLHGKFYSRTHPVLTCYDDWLICSTALNCE